MDNIENLKKLIILKKKLMLNISEIEEEVFSDSEKIENIENIGIII